MYCRQSIRPLGMLRHKVLNLGSRFAHHGLFQPLDVVLETCRAAHDLDALDAPDALKFCQIPVSDTQKHGLHDIDAQLIKTAERLCHDSLVVGQVNVETNLDMEAADAGNDAGLLDGGVPGAETGEGGQEGGMGDKGVAAIEEVGGLGVDLAVSAEEGAVDLGVWVGASGALCVGGCEEKLVVDFVADLEGEVEEVGFVVIGLLLCCSHDGRV